MEGLEAPYGALLVQEIDELTAVVRRHSLACYTTVRMEEFLQFTIEQLIIWMGLVLDEEMAYLPQEASHLYSSLTNAFGEDVLCQLFSVPRIYGDSGIRVEIKNGFLYLWYRGRHGAR